MKVDSTYISIVKFLVLLFSIQAIMYYSGTAQEMPPRPIEVSISLEQGLKFGEFYHGDSGGTITVTPSGTRTTTGDVYLVGYDCSPAVFTVQALPGTNISIASAPDAVLSSPDGSMNLTIGSTNPQMPYIAPAEISHVYIGGTLHVGNSLANPPGPYNGTFTIIFNQE